ncbi:peptidoglycan-binding domain-containing protein [Zhenhengia yiwuensis]|uniref:peptidoglycan-binding domain-containing protein n=1 Tax=Zhenhengia yiwuensis TaxID=2763666 RepID=UPI002A74767D|nr:peptidoglycan-binding protein [Zhenhengia yiwuensis]MDY3368167.1 peptidoglycan-binding protein [Zhenhengia yiwuensis]
MYPPIYPPVLSRQSTGSLIVETTTDPAIGPLRPLPGIQITVKERQATGKRIVAQLVTNANGQTPVIQLPAPPSELTEEPQTTETPFAPYIIEAQGENVIPTQINGTQIFSTIRSIQPIRLTPSEAPIPVVASRQDVEENIIIGPPTLYGDYPPKIPETSIKNTATPGFIVLPEVVVPEFIIVHAGSPNNNSASNYTVTYRDYIKNVASSEIYPTWPTETIRANVIAIISFTLNRVYTEWYRNKGKNFTITNSTAFDHAFFFGRDIFDTISEQVDQIFDIYCKRPGVEQPLLTQYCDGAKVSCPNWMTQWGSKSLGDEGLSYDEILRFYYGEDLTFPNAPVVAGVPESYPGTPLRLGDSGPAVRTIQEQLNRISNNYPLIPKVRTSGSFDEATQESVRTFQNIFHLTPDGIVGRDTWYKISEIYVAVSRIAELMP